MYQDGVKEVRLAALSATGSIVQALSSFEDKVSSLNGLVPVICGVLTQTLNEADEDSSRTVLEEVISIAEEAPKYFRKHIDAVIQLSLQVATAGHLEDETRFLAVELLLTLAVQAAPMMRKQKLFLENMVPLALQLMLQVEEVDMNEWNSTTEDDNDGTDLYALTLCVCTSAWRAQLACSLRSASCVRAALQLAPSLRRLLLTLASAT